MPTILPGQTVTLTKTQARAMMARTSSAALATGLGPAAIRWRRDPNNQGSIDGLDVYMNVRANTQIKTVILLPGTTSWPAPADLHAVVGLRALGAGGDGGAGVANTSSGASGASGDFVETNNFDGLVGGVTYDVNVALGGSQAATFFKNADGDIILQAAAGGNAAGIVPGLKGTGSIGTVKIEGTDGSAGRAAALSGGSGGSGAPGPNGPGKVGGAKGDTTRAGAGGGGANGGLSSKGNDGLGFNNAGAPGGKNRLGAGEGLGGTTTAAPTSGIDGGGAGGGGPWATAVGKGADGSFEPIWQDSNTGLWYGPGGGAGGGLGQASDLFAGAGGKGGFGAGGGGGGNYTTKFGLGGKGGDAFIVVSYITGQLPELGHDEGLYPSMLWTGSYGSGWISGTEPQTTTRGNAPQPMVTCNFVDWLTYAGDHILAINAEAVGGVHHVEVEMEGNIKKIYFKTLETIIGRNGVPRKSWAYHVRLDHARAMAFGFSRGIARLRISAVAENPAFEKRTLPPYTVYPRATEWDVIKKVAITPGFVHPTLGAADYTGPLALRDAVATASNYADRLKVVCIETGTYHFAPSTSSIDNPNYWITICGAPDVLAVIGNGSLPGGVSVEGQTKSQLKVDMLHFMGENLDFSVSGMANDGSSALTQRGGTLGRYWFDGCWISWGTYNTTFSSGVGAEALVNGKQPTVTWLYAGVVGGTPINTFFTEARVRDTGAATSGFRKYRLAWYCDIPYCSGTAYEAPVENSSTYYCSARKVGGMLPGFRPDNNAFSIRYTGAGANPTMRVMRADGVTGATNATAGMIILTAGGVSDTYSLASQGHNPATFIAWANALAKGWVVTAPTTPCRLSLSFLSRPALQPAQPWGTGLTDNALVITNVDQLITCKMDIHANCIVTTPATYNQFFFGFHGEMVGAAPFSCGVGTRRDFFMLNFSFIDRGKLFINPNNGQPEVVGAQAGYLKSGTGDHHSLIAYGSMPQSYWFYGDGDSGTLPYDDVGYNRVHSVAMDSIGFLAPSSNHVWSNLALYKGSPSYMTSIAAVNSNGLGEPLQPQNSTTTVNAGFIDQYGNLNPVVDGWLRLPSGEYAGRYDPQGYEQAITAAKDLSPQVSSTTLDLAPSSRMAVGSLVKAPEDNTVWLSLDPSSPALDY